MSSRGRVLGQIRSFHDLILLWQVLFLILATPLLLRLNLVRVGRLLEPRRPLMRRGRSRRSKAELIAFVDGVIGMIRPIIGSRCLARGIVLYYLLRRRDLAVSLCFGMGKLRGEFVGHCWLCEQGEPLAEVEDPRPLFTVYHIISPSFEPGLAAAAAGA